MRYPPAILIHNIGFEILSLLINLDFLMNVHGQAHLILGSIYFPQCSKSYYSFNGFCQ